MFLMMVYAVGSSPHTRGAPCWSAGRPRRTRIIPAYAGSTSGVKSSSSLSSDHPRIRGEHLVTCISDAKRAGSSPHTRGALVVFSLDPHFRRIIPAYAGSTARNFPNLVFATDHPRIRGEHYREIGFETIDIGSSPHTRGAHKWDEFLLMSRRIIPAYAGSTRPGRRRYT